MNRDGAAVRTLLAEGADANALGTYGTPALHWVVRVEDRTTVSLLLDAGADPNLTQRARRCAAAPRDREPRSWARSSCCWRRAQTRRSSITPVRRR